MIWRIVAVEAEGSTLCAHKINRRIRGEAVRRIDGKRRAQPPGTLTYPDAARVTHVMLQLVEFAGWLLGERASWVGDDFRRLVGRDRSS